VEIKCQGIIIEVEEEEEGEVVTWEVPVIGKEAKLLLLLDQFQAVVDAVDVADAVDALMSPSPMTISTHLSEMPIAGCHQRTIQSWPRWRSRSRAC